MKHLYLLLLTILMNNLTITMDSDDDTDYGDIVPFDLEYNRFEELEKPNVNSISLTSDTSTAESYDSHAQRLQYTQDLQELYSALKDQKSEYEHVMNYVQTHKEKHLQLSVHIIDKLEPLIQLIITVECKAYLELHRLKNFNLWPTTEKLINLHDESKWIFNWYKQEQQAQKKRQSTITSAIPSCNPSAKKRTLLKVLNKRKKS
ncbi:MAG: hypothetical protein Q8Q60_03470 [Candidatus Chromulinivorax sp.]|nr:hypothetical protein [Candidatus Chromulinivorax sp.]